MTDFRWPVGAIHDIVSTVFPVMPGHDVVSTVFPVMPGLTGHLVRIGAEPVPGLLEREVVGTEIKAVSLPGEGEAVGRRIPGILQVVLAELLGGGHIEGARVHVGDLADGVVEDLATGVRGEQPVAFRKRQVAYERVLQFADDGMRLLVLQMDREAHLPVLQGNRQVQPHIQRVRPGNERMVVDEDSVLRGVHERQLFLSRHLNLLLFQRVVIQSPQPAAPGIVDAGLQALERQEATVLPDGDQGLAILQLNLRQEGFGLRLPVTRAGGDDDCQNDGCQFSHDA